MSERESTGIVRAGQTWDDKELIAEAKVASQMGSGGDAGGFYTRMPGVICAASGMEAITLYISEELRGGKDRGWEFVTCVWEECWQSGRVWAVKMARVEAVEEVGLMVSKSNGFVEARPASVVGQWNGLSEGLGGHD